MQPSDHDLIIEIRTRLEDLRTDIKDLKEGTTARINEHEARIRSLEAWKIARTEQISDDKITIKFYFRFITGLGILILGLVIWHLTGYHI